MGFVALAIIFPRGEKYCIAYLNLESGSLVIWSWPGLLGADNNLKPWQAIKMASQSVTGLPL